MKIDTQMRDVPFERMGEEGLRFERMGFDCAWTFEASHNPFLPLALAASATRRREVRWEPGASMPRTSRLIRSRT